MTTEIDAEGLAKMQADAGIPHLPTQETYWFRKAMSGEGPHAFDWTDKPHRLVYDLCRIIEAQAAQEPPPAHPEDFEFAALLTSRDYKRTKWVVVPHGQSLDFDDDGATRRWLQPHLGKEWHLTSFVSLRDPLRALRTTTRTSEAEPVAEVVKTWTRKDGYNGKGVQWRLEPDTLPLGAKLYTLPTPSSDDQVEAVRTRMTDTIDVAALVEAWKWRAKVKGEWGLWSVVEVDPNDWTWRDYWEDLEVVPLVPATALQSQADALAEARREISEASRYLDGLLRSYVGKYCYPVPEWQPLPDLIGMLTQIDNASTVTAQFEARANDAEASLATMREALEPFASFARNNTDDDGWAGTQCQRERIVDWFGPSDFIDARRALGGSIGIPLMTERVPASQGAAQDD